MSWIYGAVGVPRPETDPGTLRTLSTQFGSVSTGYFEAAAEVSSINADIGAANEGEIADLVFAALSAEAEAYSLLSDDAAKVRDAHGDAADEIEAGVLAMDAICLSAERDYSMGQSISGYPGEIICRDAVTHAQAALAEETQGLAQRVEALYSGLTPPPAVDPMMTDSVLTVEAEFGANRLRDSFFDDHLFSGAEIADVQQVMAQLEELGVFDDPVARARFIETLGPDGVEAFWRVVRMAEENNSGDLTPELRQFSGVLADSVGVMSPESLETFLDGSQVSILYGSMRLAPWPDEQTLQLVEVFTNNPWGPEDYASDYPPSLIDDIAIDGALPVDRVETGAGLLYGRPDLAHQFLTDPGQRDALRNILTMDSTITAGVLEQGLLDHVAIAEDPEQAARATGDTLAWMMDERPDIDGPNGAAVMRVSGLFMDDIQHIAEHRGGADDSSFRDVTVQEATDFFGDVLDSPEAAAEAGHQVALYHDRLMDQAMSGPNAVTDVDDLRSYAIEADRVSSLLESAMRDEVNGAYEHSMANTLGNAAVTVGSSFLPAGVSGLAEVVGGAAVDGLTPDQTFDQSAYNVSQDQRDMVMTVQTLVEHHEQLGGDGAVPYGLTSLEWATLQDPRFLSAVSAGDPAANLWLERLLDNDVAPQFNEVYEDLREVFHESREN